MSLNKKIKIDWNDVDEHLQRKNFKSKKLIITKNDDSDSVDQPQPFPVNVKKKNKRKKVITGVGGAAFVKKTEKDIIPEGKYYMYLGEVGDINNLTKALEPGMLILSEAFCIPKHVGRGFLGKYAKSFDYTAAFPGLLYESFYWGISNVTANPPGPANSIGLNDVGIFISTIDCEEAYVQNQRLIVKLIKRALFSFNGQVVTFSSLDHLRIL